MRTEDVEKNDTIAAVDAVTEARLLRKLDMRIIPMICWIYLMNFMDRGRLLHSLEKSLLTSLVNIGNARLYGLEEDLGMAGNQYQLAVSLLFVTYVVSCTPQVIHTCANTWYRFLRRPRI